MKQLKVVVFLRERKQGAGQTGHLSLEGFERLRQATETLEFHPAGAISKMAIDHQWEILDQGCVTDVTDNSSSRAKNA
jgi:hypothetical protein